ncbi:branched-chain amino acid ABC transporter permease [Marinomonas posidonica]|uniref:ABC-type transporter, integral membrane subunit n=1 Tax=Marinomonas posidonica (strain CECT 7376 / NCIMB 14433 / IVIA-Po-181) TaxID=491952 RepID=F6CVG7_MARPP|nr:branched-chain amino acid ABC transporter permease [Marinomonas posidonica]AEF55344.1 ABC-type transporter, integral membrane subunit [Marinomonas posidonica IVIA-Po-181]
MSIKRSNAYSNMTVISLVLLLMVLVMTPFAASDNVLERLTVLFIYIIMAAMWNTLAGFGGLVSIGQQLFFGLGAYATIRLAHLGISPFVAVSLAALLVGLLSWPISKFMLHLKAAEFGIGMWVLASVGHLLVNLDPLIQGETGTSLISLNVYPIGTRRVLIYLAALISMSGLLIGLFYLLRSKAGIAMQAIRDNEEAADSIGVDAQTVKKWFFIFAAFGTGLAGALWLAQASSFQPKTYFSVQWTAYMIFMVLVGGIGRFEGAILGALLFFAVETWFAATGVWYLVGLGAVAVLCSLFLPKGLWGAIESRLGLRLIPVGYQVTNETLMLNKDKKNRRQ